MSAPGAPTPPPAPPAGTAPEGAPGPASQQQQRQGNQGFWGRFPNVPEEHREMLEPHLKGVQAHVTRLEQQLAPFKGMSPQAVNGLAQFARQFDANPKQMFLTIAADLQRRGILHEALDLEALQAVIDGVDPDGEAVEEELPDGNGDIWAEAPPWALELRQGLQGQQEREQQAARQKQEATEDAMLTKTLATMKAKLTEAGYPAEWMTDARLTAQLLTHGGNATAAIKDAVDGRNLMLKGLVKPKPGDQEPTMPRGVPPHKKSTAPSDALKQRDPIKAAGAGAEQYLRRAAQEAQQ